MSKTKKTPRPRDIPKLPAQAAPPPAQSHAVRETVESIVIAFVLAFLFRTFEAEAFVIPTGSMAPTLMGRHKDVDCPKCGYRFQVSASEEDSDNPRRMTAECVAGMCPMCQFVVPMRPDLRVPESRTDTPVQRSYNGDRILVNKYIYTFAEPERWDVVVFKFPGDAKINYIKRLVGLPGETLRIARGDLFVRRGGAAAPFEIARKAPDKILAMRQLVHDTNYDPAELEAAGWPLRWHSATEGEAGWQIAKSIEGNNVEQRYSVNAPAGETAWLRYEHLLPDFAVWQSIADMKQEPSEAERKAVSAKVRAERRRLITDANPYNARQDSQRLAARGTLEIDGERQGLHWVGDLMMEADVQVESEQGELLLDLVEGGRHFTCTIDLATGVATLAAQGAAEFAPKATTSLKGAGKYRVAFANVDDALLLWVDGDVISFDTSTAYDVQQVFGDAGKIRPQTSEEDPGDLAPAGIGARNAKITATRLRVWRDIYYIADDSRRNPHNDLVTDFDHRPDPQIRMLPYDPSLWHRFEDLNAVEFQLVNDQFFVMGDNSAESSDARLWLKSAEGKPGGAYLERRLLIGKALCVYWPHSWNRIPGTPIPFPLFPNFADMRLVR